MRLITVITRYRKFDFLALLHCQSTSWDSSHLDITSLPVSLTKPLFKTALTYTKSTQDTARINSNVRTNKLCSNVNGPKDNLHLADLSSSTKPLECSSLKSAEIERTWDL